MTSSDTPWVQIARGSRRRTLNAGPLMHQMVAEPDAKNRLREHKHPHEQGAHVVQGHMQLIIGGVAHELKVGDSYYIPSNQQHRVDTIEATVVIDTFRPAREGYLAQDQCASVRRAARR